MSGPLGRKHYCGECAWWSKIEHKQLEGYTTKDNQGECRAGLPILGRSVTESTYWCGRWKEKRSEYKTR